MTDPKRFLMVRLPTAREPLPVTLVISSPLPPMYMLYCAPIIPRSVMDTDWWPFNPLLTPGLMLTTSDAPTAPVLPMMMALFDPVVRNETESAGVG